MKIGIDMGGTKIEGIVLDNRGMELSRKRIPTPHGTYRDIISALVGLINELHDTAGGQCTIGFGTPGSLNTEGLIRNSNTTELNGKPLLDDLEAALKQAVRISNDANCFTLSETVDGAATGYDNVFGVIIGTGTGGGLVLNGRLLTGSNNIAGEWGHNPLPWPTTDELPGKPCFCGKRGCIETFLSGPALTAYFHAATGVRLSPAQIAVRAAQGDAKADAVLARYEDQLARGLASVINLVDPQCIVLGGGLSNITRLYQRVPDLWTRHISSDSVNTQLLPPKHGDSSGVRGAAWLWD
ncbi:MAG: ROK family protein [Cellvibrionaceae bacterium]